MIKLKIMPKFPSSVTAESPVVLEKTNGNYNFSLDTDALPIPPAFQDALDARVAGPASATDDLPVVFDGISGKLIKSKTYAAFKTLLALAKGDVGLGNVDNTSDANKPVSTAQATALAAKVTGPAGAGDNLPALFNGTTGTLIKSASYAAFKTSLVLVKGDVGLGNVANADTTNATNLSSGTVPVARLPTQAIPQHTVGANIAPDSLQTINANTGASVAPLAGTNLHIIGADSTANVFTMDGYAQTTIQSRYAGGTQAAKTVPTSTQIMFSIASLGWDTSTYGTGVNIQFRATQTWTTSAHGAEIALRTVPNGSTTIADAFVASKDGDGIATRYLQTGAVAVASLPAAAAGNKGARYFVTDANATTFWSIVAGGGANNVPVTSDGTNWRIG